MNTSQETGPLRRRLLALGVFATLLAQMSLPALHALERGACGVAAWRVASVEAAAVRVGQTPVATHDPAKCPVCRSLLRASPVAGAPASGAESSAERRPAPPVARACAPSTAAQVGHPPRAPPADRLHLV